MSQLKPYRVIAEGHCHAGEMLHAGDEIEMDKSSAEWAMKMGIVEPVEAPKPSKPHTATEDK